MRKLHKTLDISIWTKRRIAVGDYEWTVCGSNTTYFNRFHSILPLYEYKYNANLPYSYILREMLTINWTE